MKLKSVALQNFRASESLNLELGQRLTLLLGGNGSGKTSVLDAIGIGLGAALTHLPAVSGTTFKKHGDIRQCGNALAPFTRIGITTTQGLEWDRIQRRDKSKAAADATPAGKGLKALEAYLDRHVIDPMNSGAPFQLPIFAFYGVHRAVLDTPLRRKGFPKSHTRLEALEHALDARSTFKSAFVWFYNKENEEHRLQKEQRSFDASLPQLDAVRRAISSIIPEVTSPHIVLNPLRFAVNFRGEMLDLMQLSDGYKTLLGLVIDLSIRMALANPHLDDPLAAEAVVMIDEIDLHLHPSWQRQVLGNLLRTFSNTQFILTTHSPFVVEALNNHLKRHALGDAPTQDSDIDKLLPLAVDDVHAYLMENSEARSLIDTDSGLIDDTLLASFNELNMLYDRMRDIEWNRADDQH